MRDKETTRRQALGVLARGVALLGSASLGACAVGSGGGLETTSALPPSPHGAPGAATGGEPTEPVKAALILPLGGGIQLGLVGKGLQQAAELALFDRNVAGFQLVVRDDAGTPEGAAAAATTAIADGAEIILGPLLGPSVAAVAPIARSAGVPVIAFSNDIANGGNGVHLLSFFVAAEVGRVVDHAIGQGRRHFAALISDDLLGADCEPAFRRAVEQGGGRIAVIERYPADLSGMMQPAKTVFEAIRGSADSDHPIDALFLPSSGDNVGRLAAMLRHHNLDPGRVKLLVTSGWDNPAALREARVAGAWMAGPDPRGWNELSARFAQTYGAMPPRLASLAYDAVTVATAFATQPKGRRYIAENLLRAQGFAGIDGQFRLTPHGSIERSLAVLEIGAQGPVVVDGARGFNGGGAQPITAPLGRETWRG